MSAVGFYVSVDGPTSGPAVGRGDLSSISVVRTQERPIGADQVLLLLMMTDIASEISSSVDTDLRAACVSVGALSSETEANVLDYSTYSGGCCAPF